MTRRGANSTPRIVFFTDATDRGGAEVVLRHLLCGLGSGFDAVVMGPDAGVTGWVAAVRPGTPAVVAPQPRGRSDVAAFWALRRAIARTAPDLFHANLQMLAASQYAILAALSLRHLPVIAVEHTPVQRGSRSSRLLKRATSRRLAAHVAVSNYGSSEVERLVGLPRGSVRTIYNGVPDVPVRPEPRQAPGPVVGALGRLEPPKGIDVLVRAVARLPGVTLVLGGLGTVEPHLRQLAQDLGIPDRVVFRGWIEQPRAALASFDVLAFPSRPTIDRGGEESNPLVLLEAMTVGVPVVASDLPSTRELIDDGRTGVLVPPDDDDALAGALEGLLHDRARREALSQQASAAVARFGYDVMVRNYEQLYEEVLSARQRGVRPRRPAVETP